MRLGLAVTTRRFVYTTNREPFVAPAPPAQEGAYVYQLDNPNNIIIITA
jgi:hypothetical protein